MSLETGTYIDDLVATNPTSGDQKSQGDDHLRLIKSVLKNTFPNLDGAMTATQAVLNGVPDMSGFNYTDGNFLVGNGSTLVEESGSTARTSLGLGTVATQSAASVAFTGGAMSNMAITGTTYVDVSGAAFAWVIDTSFSCTALIETSDAELKENWEPVQDGFLGKLADMPCGTFNFIGSETRQAGSTYQAMEELLPEACQYTPARTVVGGDGEPVQRPEHKGVSYGSAAFVAVVELAKEVKALKAEIALLKEGA